MKKKANNISKEQALEMQIKLLKENIKQLEKENADLKAQLARKYRRTSEAISSDQLLLFNEAEFNVEDGILNDNSDDLPEDNSAADTSVLSDKAKRKYVKRKSQYSMLNLPADMPVTVIHNQGKAPVCDSCGTTKVKVGERVHDTIVKTTSYSIVRRITDVYECPKCDGSVKSTPKTDNILENTVVDPLMLADILNSKFNMGVPLYRQERLFKEQGVKITRHLMSALIMYVGKKIIDNLEPVLEEEVFKMPLINADETPMKVIKLYDEDGNKKAPNSRENSFIIGRIGVDDNGSPGYSIFTFSDNRRNQTIADLFDKYPGLVQTDGLSGYTFAEKNCSFTHIGCLVHCRRKCIEASEGRTKGVAVEMKKRYAKIFHEEGKWEDLRGTISKEEFVEGRKAALLPLFEDMKAWLEEVVKQAKETGAEIENKTSIAINYFLDRYDELTRFLDYYCANSNNNRAEQFVRKWKINLNNFLFCITETGADVSAFFFSLITSCRNLGINPTDYLAHLFLNCNMVKSGDREAWRALLPGKCKLDDVIELRKKIAEAKPLEGRTEPYVLRGRNN
ncbi:IS66 family transposase [Spirochaetales bacterium NM-380-WT-3C1]|uniref:IS66 family transposase n=1 Tax=Bullifex porci TaxID=2606638 RepID=A0A7X2TR98_9SPIO|nr:IS66 family transposase [Bullifex porci]MSU07324.1 IS66 family transposase [Bullifex porci]